MDSSLDSGFRAAAGFGHGGGLTVGVEHKDAHSPLVPGLVKRRQLVLSAGEAVAIGAQDVESVGCRGGGGR
jgi:hypothetical protein